MFDLDAALAETVRLGASDLHIKVPSTPRVRVHGELYPLPNSRPITTEDTDAIREKVLRSAQKRDAFEEHGSADLSYFTPEGRFRVSAFSQRGSSSFVFRTIGEPPEPHGLGIPDVVLGWSQVPRGLVVVTGPTGQGKSTTMACLVGLINQRRSCHVVTIEDPIEFLHSDDRALVSQREIGSDAPSYHTALRAALRQDPDVIMIGEVRDEETAVTALRAAETGHLVLCTMHTADASETIQRFVDLFSQDRVDMARAMLASTLVGVVSQRLVPSVDGTRMLNTEVLCHSSRVRDLIGGGADLKLLHQALAEGDFYGMHTFDQSLLELVREGRVATEDAMALSSTPHDFKLMLAEVV
jgi:twitching motility protein PilT